MDRLPRPKHTEPVTLYPAADHSMRHHAEKFVPGDCLQLSLVVDAELAGRELVDGGQLLSIRVTSVKNRSNDKKVLWSQGPSGSLKLQVEVGNKQRLLAIGMSARQRANLQEHLAALSAAEAQTLLASIAGASPKAAKPGQDSDETAR